MRHEFIDHHSHGDSFFHRMHPGAKMVMVIIYILCIVSLQPGQEVFLIPYALILFAMLAATRVPLLHSLIKGAKLLPFVLILTVLIPFLKEGAPRWSFHLVGIPVVCTEEGVALFLNIVGKSVLAIYSTVFLNLTTPFESLLKGMQSFGAPRIMTDTLVIAYRYLFVIAGERERMLLARQARRIRPTWIVEWRSLSQLIGMLFIRSYNRGERLYQAMCARGFHGTIITLHERPLLPKDLIAVTLVVSIAIIVRVGAMVG